EEYFDGASAEASSNASAASSGASAEVLSNASAEVSSDASAEAPTHLPGRSGVSGPCAAPGRVVVLTALHCWPPRRRRAGLGLRPDARAFLDGTRRFAQQITPDPGGSALTSGLGGRPLQARRLHVSSHMGP